MKISLNIVIFGVICLFAIIWICTKRYFSYEKYAFAQVVDFVKYDTGRGEGCAYIRFVNGKELYICAYMSEDIYTIKKGDSIYKPVDKDIFFVYRKDINNKFTLEAKIK